MLNLLGFNDAIRYRFDMKESTPIRSGRKRSAASQEKAIAAAFDVLRERGYAGMSIEAVAERARVGKTTIYRWWPDKAALAVDAFFAITKAELAFPDTGSALEDFRLQILQLGQLLRGPSGEAMAAMVAGAKTDPQLASALGERWLVPRRKWGVERMERAVADNECLPDLDIEAALRVLYGPLYAPLLFGAGIPPPERINAYLAIAFRGIFHD
ncbi:MAG: TetR/AcrR family transcriptional regulator [Chitinophagales bacterium]|nr:TetR/AcrR family transcriptional regulator [Hyphomicrobiales bacterium]